jgi:hypothetical protein
VNALNFTLIAASLYVWTVCRLCKKQQPPFDPGPCGNPHRMLVIGTRERIMDGVDYTVVLYRCRHCETHHTQLHHGKWDLGDFIRSENEIDQLEAMRRRA